MWKKALCLIFAFLLSINSMAAVVSDNDGSAFVTKAEFEALKRSFADQIDNYNTSIDSKIDGAIAAYLTGIKLEQITKEKTLVDYAKDNYVWCYDVNSPLNYKYGWPIIYGDFAAICYTYDGGWYREVGAKASVTKGVPTSSNYQNKTVITNVKKIKDTTDDYFATWYGYCKNAFDYIYASVAHLGRSDGNNVRADQYKYLIATGQGSSYSSGLIKQTDTNVINSPLFYLRSCTAAIETQPNGYGMFGGTNGTQIITPFYYQAKCRGIEHDWGTLDNEEIVINKSYDYDMFSNLDRDKNWGYFGTYMTNFISGFPKTNGQRWVVVSDGGGSYNKTDNPNYLKYCCSGTLTSYHWSTNWANATTRNDTCYYPDSVQFASYTNRSGTDSDVRFYFPILGFEDTYLKKWNRIVSKNTSSIAEKEVALNNTSTGIIKDTNGKSFLNVCAGLPVASMDKNESLNSLNITFDTNGTYMVWFSNRPFNPDLNPQDNTNLINKMKGGTYDNTYKGYVVTGKDASFSYDRDNLDEGEIIYMKWAKYTAPSTLSAKVGVKLGDYYYKLVK